MNKPERPDFEYYLTVAKVVKDRETLAAEIVVLVREAQAYIEYIEAEIKNME